MVRLGATKDGIAAVVGPCICQDSYEVGPEFYAAVMDVSPLAGRCFRVGRRGHFWFDLPGYVVGRIRKAGVGRVESLGVDTCAEEARFFSHRRRTLNGGHPIGHQISVIRL